MNKIICAIDYSDINQAKELINKIKNNVGMVKLGLEFFTKYGAKGVKEIQELGVDIFLDLKFYDIPNTVAKAIYQASYLGVKMITIHTQGGIDMMRAAKKASLQAALDASITPPIILGVTVLTSMDESDFQHFGGNISTAQLVNNLATNAANAGLDGCVCSAHEIQSLKQKHPNLQLVVPGIRPEGSNADDQKRIMTPSEAVNLGADYLVIGRPITQSQEPNITAQKIATSI